ncbi:MAG: dTDP-4-dehydrorhamnose reductase [Pseudomonadota bacterium]
MSRFKILVAGRSGQVAQSLVEAAALRERIDLTCAGRPDLDIADLGSVRSAVSEAKPNLVINAAAYTAVDKAEDDRDAAFAGNETGPENLAKVTVEAGIPLFHISTDYVFSGQATAPYTEDHPTDPLGVYGSSKLAGEQAVAHHNPKHLILRTAWVYGVYGANFLKTMLRVAEGRNELNVVADQYGAPTSSHDIASGLLDLAEAVLADPNNARWGTFHMSAGGDAVWAEFAEAIFAASAINDGPSATVNRIPTTEYPTPAERPAFSVLNSSALEQAYGVRLPHWKEPVAGVVARVLQHKE